MPDRLTTLPSGSPHADVNGWLDKLKHRIPRAAYLDLQAAVDKLAFIEDLHEVRWAHASQFKKEYTNV